MSSLINWKRAIEQLGDKEFFVELLEEYIQTTPEKITSIKQLFLEDNLPDLKLVIHSLKGVSANLFLEKMHQLCIDVEEKIKISSLEKPDINNIEENFNLIIQEFKEEK